MLAALYILHFLAVFAAVARPMSLGESDFDAFCVRLASPHVVFVRCLAQHRSADPRRSSRLRTAAGAVQS
jgi:hypothetical protein